MAHNLEAVGSIPTPATNDFSGLSVTDGLFFRHGMRKSLEDERLLFEILFRLFFYSLDPFQTAVRLLLGYDNLTIT